MQRRNKLNALSQERTFLAWIRTAVALLGFGFVIVKFDVLLMSLGHNTQALRGGIWVTLAGGVVAVLATIRYLLGLAEGRRSRARAPFMAIAVAALVLVLSLLLAREMLQTI